MHTKTQAMRESLPASGVAGLAPRVLDQVRKQLGCGRVRRALVGGNSQPGTKHSTHTTTTTTTRLADTPPLMSAHSQWRGP